MRYTFSTCIVAASLTLAGLFHTASLVPAAEAPAISVTYQIPGNITEEEKKWYKTFQEGNLLADGWVDISKDILARLPTEHHTKQQENLLQLGDKIGREWTKHNKTRKINTDMLKKWGQALKDASKKNPEALTAAITDIDRQVDTILRY